MHNGILLRYIKEHIWVSSNKVDETGAYYTEWSKSERKTPIQYINAIYTEFRKMVTMTLYARQQKGWCEELTHLKDPDAGRDWGQEEKGTTEDETAGWHHWHNGHGFGWTPGVGDRQGGLACWGSWGRRVVHDWATELNWIELCVNVCVCTTSSLSFHLSIDI